MSLRALLGTSAIVAFFAALVYAGTCPVAEIQTAFRNLDFAQGKPGDRPPGWLPSDPECFLPPFGVYLPQIAPSDACYVGSQCGVLKSIRTDSSYTRWGLFQVVDAIPYRGKKMILRAALRADVAPGSDARLMVRVHLNDGSTGFFDNMGRFPVRSNNWSFHEIEAPITQTARDIEFGLQLDGQGAAWIDGVSVSFANAAN